MLSDLRIRLRSLFRRQTVEAELDDELRFHLEREIEKYIQAGMSPEQAKRRAQIRLGGIEQVKEECRDARGLRVFESLLQDVRFGLRMLWKSPGFTAVALITLALGIGANTAMFRVVDGVLLRPLDYPNASRLISLNTVFTKEDRSIPRVTGPDVVDLRTSTSSLDEVTFYNGGEMGVQMADHAEFVGTYRVTPSFVSVFGTEPLFGRGLEAEDVERGALVGVAFARRNFGSGEAALGKTIHMEGVAYEIVGVMPAAFGFPAGAQVWLALSPQPQNTNRTAYNYRAVGLLRPGTSLRAANAQLSLIGSRLAAAYPDANQNKTFRAEPLKEHLVGSVRTTLLFLMGAVLLVLLIACANVANMSLARATARQREMAVRAAMGASRGAIARQLFVESAVLGLLGGALGVLFAAGGTALLTRATEQQGALPRMADLSMDWTVVAFAIGSSLLASVLFGVSPAWQASKVDVNDSLKQAGRGLAGSTNRLRSTLVVVQVALSFALAIGAGLLFRSFLTLNSVDLGFRSKGMLVMYAHDPAKTLEDYVAVGRRFETLFGELQQMPGISAAAGAMGVPTGQYGSNGSYAIDGQDFEHHLEALPHADFSLASPEYFSTMGIPLLRGRDFAAGDVYDAPPVAIVSRSLARQTFGDEDPVGHRILCGLDRPDWMTIIGVVADVRQDSPASRPGPTLYMPLQQHPYRGNEIEVVMRTSGSPTSMIAAVRNKVRSENPQVAMKFTTLEAMVSDSIATPRLRMLLVGLFASLALVLAMAGVYGVMSCVTSQRIPEFGVRMALGAAPHGVILLVLRRAARMAVLGIAIGLAIAFSAARLLGSMLYGLKATDAVTYAGVLLAVMLIILLAASVPAWRAARVDPVSTLRNE